MLLAILVLVDANNAGCPDPAFGWTGRGEGDLRNKARSRSRFLSVCRGKLISTLCVRDTVSCCFVGVLNRDLVKATDIRPVSVSPRGRLIHMLTGDHFAKARGQRGAGELMAYRIH